MKVYIFDVFVLVQILNDYIAISALMLHCISVPQVSAKKEEISSEDESSEEESSDDEDDKPAAKPQAAKEDSSSDEEESSDEVRHVFDLYLRPFVRSCSCGCSNVVVNTRPLNFPS